MVSLCLCSHLGGFGEIGRDGISDGKGNSVFLTLVIWSIHMDDTGFGGVVGLVSL